MAFANAMQFKAGLKNWQKQHQLDANQAALALALNLAENIIRATPVDTGWARANWWPQINTKNAPPNAGVPNPRTSTQGLQGKAKAQALDRNGQAGASASMARAASTFAQGKAGDRFTLANGVPYILKLEYGSSKQAPEGMVRLSIQRLRHFFENYKAPQGGNNVP